MELFKPFSKAALVKALACGSALLMLAACAQSQRALEEESQSSRGLPVFRMNLGTEPPDLDPVKISDLTSFTVIQNLMRGLTYYDKGLKPQPAVAERWDRSADGMRYVFYLRPNARWSDGKPVTAGQFVDAWQRALTPETAADYAFFLYEIKNAKAYYEGTLKDFSKVGVRALNDQTLVVELERPTPFFLDLLAAPIALPFRKDLYARYGERYTEAGHFAANGPYRLAAWAHDDYIRLTPNPYYYGEKPAVAVKMVMVNDTNTSTVMYENNELDFIETTTSIASFDVRRLRKSPDAHVNRIHRINYFGFNLKKPPFDDVRVRKAFAMALDRNYYPKLLQSGQKPIKSWISPGLVGYNDSVGLAYNPEKARQLLAEAGYPDGKGFPDVTLAYRTLYDIQKEAEIAQYLWKKNLNVDVRLQNMEWKVYLSQLRQDASNLYMMGWFVDYPDADSYMSMMIGDSGNNYTGWKSERYDSLVSQAVVTLDADKRQKLYDDAQRILLEKDAVMVPTYQAEKTWLLKPWVKGLEINALNLISLDHLKINRKQ
ncbi:MAG: peptide ABC transporter substrate-binding protein [Vampirovibrionales bacterium]|nr:peptide ABC transporter substrate-binding protein [Vampirovibrionales bacterium]